MPACRSTVVVVQPVVVHESLQDMIPVDLLFEPVVVHQRLQDMFQVDLLSVCAVGLRRDTRQVSAPHPSRSVERSQRNSQEWKKKHHAEGFLACELELSQLLFVSSESYQRGEKLKLKWVTQTVLCLLVNVVYPSAQREKLNERAATTGAGAPLPKRKGRRVLRVVVGPVAY